MIARANRPLHDTSVVLCTCDRPEGALAAVQSVLRDVPTTQVIVVDQSQSDETEHRLKLLMEGTRGRVIRAEPRGLGVARNLGVTVLVRRLHRVYR
jgi:glycosyltransferase involved in cell wall biosynthesis